MTAEALPADVVARLRRLRLVTNRRVAGRYAGGHASRRFGSSLDFADYRNYVPGDDPRRVDLAAYRRLGRLLVKLYEAEDEAPVRVAVDLSVSMGFGRKAALALEVAAALAVVATAGGDRVRVALLHADGVDTGPWYRGGGTPAALDARLRAAAPTAGGGGGGGTGADPAAGLAAALRRLHSDGPAGPLVVVTDLLMRGWEDVVRALGAGRGDGVVVHVLGEEDLEPRVRGDLRLTDSETGEEVEVGVAEQALAAYAAARDSWLDAVAAECGAAGVLYTRATDADTAEEVVASRLRRLGVVA